MGVGVEALEFSMNGRPTATRSAPHLVREASVGPGSAQSGLWGGCGLLRCPPGAGQNLGPSPGLHSSAPRKYLRAQGAPQPGKGTCTLIAGLGGLEANELPVTRAEAGRALEGRAGRDSHRGKGVGWQLALSGPFRVGKVWCGSRVGWGGRPSPAARVALFLLRLASTVWHLWPRDKN